MLKINKGAIVFWLMTGLSMINTTAHAQVFNFSVPVNFTNLHDNVLEVSVSCRVYNAADENYGEVDFIEETVYRPVQGLSSSEYAALVEQRGTDRDEDKLIEERRRFVGNVDVSVENNEPGLGGRGITQQDQSLITVAYSCNAKACLDNRQCEPMVNSVSQIELWADPNSPFKPLIEGTVVIQGGQ